VLLAIFIFGGDVIRGFTFALLIGVVVGTYSSLFIATPVVYDTIKGDETTRVLKGTVRKEIVIDFQAENLIIHLGGVGTEILESMKPTPLFVSMARPRVRPGQVFPQAGDEHIHGPPQEVIILSPRGSSRICSLGKDHCVGMFHHEVAQAGPASLGSS
jgi:hypothetical protein